MKPRLFVLGPLLLATGVACHPAGQPPPAPEGTGVAHLFAAGEVAALDLRRIGELRPAAGLELGDFLRQGASSGLPAARDAEAVFRVARPVDAGLQDLLEVGVEGLPAPAGASLVWSSIDGERRETATIVARVPSHTGSGRQTLRFDLAADPRWHGPVAGLELRFAGATGDFRLVEVRSSKRVISAEERAAMRGRVFQVELDHEVREAAVLAPGEPWRTPIQAPRGSRLRLALAATPGVGAPIEIRLRLAPRGPGGAPATELVRRFGSLSTELGRWLEWQVPASVEDGELTIEWVLPPGAGRPVSESSGFVFLAGPAVIPAERSGPPNVLLISLDTLRADHMSLYGYSRPTSPELDAWASRHAVVFESAVAAAGSTLPSHTSMFTGLDVLHHGATGASPAEGRLETLAESLRHRGYTTRAWTGGAFLDPRFGLAQGFEVFRYWPRGEVEASREIEDGFGRVRAWLGEGLEEPFFVFLHTYEIHGPYRARNPWWQSWGGASAPAAEWETARIWPRSRAAEASAAPPLRPGEDPFRASGGPVVQFGRDERPLVGGELAHPGDFYDSGIAKADLELSRLLAELERTGLAERTIVVITSDHGESLGEHGLWSHGYLFEDNLHVPLVIAVPGSGSAGRRVASTVGLVDLAPTVLDLAGLPVPTGVDGRSLTSWLGRKEPAAPQTADRTYLSYAWDTRQGVALRRGGLKLILRDSLFAPPGFQENFDLAKDPGELRNLAPAAPAGGGFEDLRREAWRRLVAPRQPGVTLQVANRGRRAVVTPIRLDGSAPADFRAAAPPCSGCVALTAAGDLELRLPPGEFVRFWVAGDRPRIALEFQPTPGGPPYRLEVPRERLCGKALDITPPNPEGLVITAAVEGTCSSDPGNSGALEDASLRARLEALGYL